MEYYYTLPECVDAGNHTLKIDDFEFKHLVKVLRKQEGDKITVTDGKGNLYYCRIQSIDKSNLICKILDKEFNLYEPGVSINLHMSLLKNFSRYEFAAEKCVELGVNSITPLISDLTISKNPLSNSKMERMRKIIIAAMGQSQRCFLPELHNSVTFGEMISKTENEVNKVVMYEFSDDDSEFQFNNKSKSISLLIGPEGGFSNNEIEELRKKGWQVKTLGRRKYRAETAAIVSVYDLISKIN